MVLRWCEGRGVHVANALEHVFRLTVVAFEFVPNQRRDRFPDCLVHHPVGIHHGPAHQNDGSLRHKATNPHGRPEITWAPRQGFVWSHWTGA